MLFEAVELRTDGTAFRVRLALSDPRAALARNLTPSLLQAFAGHDDRLNAFDALANGTLKIGEADQANLSVYAPAVLATLKDVAKLSDGIMVRTTLEHERAARHLAYLPRAVYEQPEPDRTVSACQNRSDHVVLYGPRLRRDEVALLEFALQELRRDIAVVCDGDDVDAALAGATVVVDATLDHPGNAIELACAGYTVVAASTTGAHEYLYGVIEYEPWNHRSIFAAVVTALGSMAPPLIDRVTPPEPAISSTVHGPAVSIVVRTYNRPALLRRALDSLAKQTYKNIEIIVVNDAGVDVEDIAAGLQNAKYVHLQANRGTSGAANEGIRAATGAYVGFLDDDDIVFPDHVATLVGALIESGADIAHSDTIAAHFDRDEAGGYRPAGYVVFLDGIVEPTDFYVTDAIGPMSVLVKKELLLAVGGFEESLTHAEDWELFLKLSQHHDFIHVPKITGMYSIRHDGSHMMSNAGAKIALSMERLMELHPLAHRPVMETARRESIEKFRASGYLARFPEPALKRT